ncbi:MAG: hypothetical protein F4192_00935 [Gemmatimonadetes bacterium]|nr:hypothetical protein [Gemmatimonadota bacterium]
MSHCLPVGHVGLHISDFASGIGFWCRFLDSPSARDDHHASSSLKQPTRQETADPTRAARNEGGPSRANDRIVIAQVHRNWRSVIHEYQFARVPGL